jgi:hypothetical protein
MRLRNKRNRLAAHAHHSSANLACEARDAGVRNR